MKRGSVTVVFSLVFLILLSFILSFFEMAAYTARMAHHAAASVLAVENYFAGYLNPLYEEYHLFGREVPVGVSALPWTEQTIKSDLIYMTGKETNTKSLLLRSPAEFSVETMETLTSKEGEGFYSQAVTAMKYRGILEVKELLEEFRNVTKQADSQMQILAAKTATDTAYAKVEEKLLDLIGKVDGVKISEYELFLRGEATVFMADAYAKYYYSDGAEAAGSFERTEVYQAFCGKSKNAVTILEDFAARAAALSIETRNREQEELEYSLARDNAEFVQGENVKEIARLEQETEKLEKEIEDQEKQLKKLKKAKKKDEEKINALTEAIQAKKLTIEENIVMAEACWKTIFACGEEITGYTAELTRLGGVRTEQEKTRAKLSTEEDAFLLQCGNAAVKCDEAVNLLTEIQGELELAKKVKADFEGVLNTVALVFGEDAVKEYRKELATYTVYESAGTYDFQRMKTTLQTNAAVLRGMTKQIGGLYSSSLLQAANDLEDQAEKFEDYSFEGLRLNYGKMSLGINAYERVTDMVKKEAGMGFLQLLTEEPLSEKTLEKSFLPSGFRYGAEAQQSPFSMLGMESETIMEELRAMLPQDASFTDVVGAVTDSVLFHSYLVSHFSDYTSPNEVGALSYETEYLINGAMEDTTNLAGVAMRICGIRAVLQFVSLYGDSARRMQAEQAALAACGVIGLPALVNVVTVALLLVWAVEEAVVETAALLLGKKLPFYPGSTKSVAFSDLFLFSGSFVRNRAKMKAEATGVGFGYGEYLQLLLLTTKKEKKCYRAMDLVQENMRIYYKDSFRLDRCVWKVNYKTNGRSYSYSYDW